jgi:methionyl-tRNA formyltransferase
MRAVFFGTPALAVPALEALTKIATVVGVVCQPDRPAGRGLSLHEPEVKQAAVARGLEVYQPVKVRSGELQAWLAERAPDVAVVLAYGRILPQAVLDVPRAGFLNLHASILPRYRGAAPIQWAIVRGEVETGMSLMQMEASLDAGPVYSRHVIDIGADETAGELGERLAKLAANVVLSDVERAVSGGLIAERQDETQVTLAPPLERAHGILDFTRPARELHNLVRGLAPRPGASTSVKGKQLRFTATRLTTSAPALSAGEIRIERPRVLVGTADGALELVRAQLEGKRELPALDLVNGRALTDGQRLGEPHGT